MPKGVPNKKYTPEFKKVGEKTKQEEPGGNRKTGEKTEMRRKGVEG